MQKYHREGLEGQNNNKITIDVHKNELREKQSKRQKKTKTDYKVMQDSHKDITTLPKRDGKL